MGDVSPANPDVCHSCGSHNLDDARFCAHCGVSLSTPVATATSSGTSPAYHAHPAPESLADPLIGVIIAERYRILELLGRGGMGVVYKVEHTRIGKLMALKLLTGELTRDSDQVKRFRREAMMVSKLSHPNTVQVFDFGSGDGLTYLAMEYLRGVDLGHLVEAEGPLSPIRTARLMIQICSSLAEAHDKDIVHRDLKPENIMVMPSPTGHDVVKVLDFGLAKLRESRELGQVTTRGAIVGTPYYMSPEQVQGEGVDQRSDVYALGALMHVCLTGAPVFDAPSPLAVLSKQLTEPPRPPSARFPKLNIPVTFSQLVMRCLNKDPRQRFQTARDLQAALLAALRGLGQSGTEELLDDERLRKLADHGHDAATRAEVEKYEQKLKRRGHFAYALVALVLAGALYAGTSVWLMLNQTPQFLGEETEPNNKAAEANAIPFGKSVSGMLGKRLDASRSDRDFYSFQIPKLNSGERPEALSLALSPLPNMALCAWLYSAGSNSPLGRYCAGDIGTALEVSQLNLVAGDYLVAVLQDDNEYLKGEKPPVHENISDSYTLKLQTVPRRPDYELEPNGHLEAAEMLAAGDFKRAALSYARDEDAFCAKGRSGLVSFEVKDAVKGIRNPKAALQVVPTGGPDDEVPVRVHPKQSEVEVTPRDQLSPYSSAPVDLAKVSPFCIKVSLVANPWAPTPHPAIAPPSHVQYSVLLKEVSQEPEPKK